MDGATSPMGHSVDDLFLELQRILPAIYKAAYCPNSVYVHTSFLKGSISYKIHLEQI